MKGKKYGFYAKRVRMKTNVRRDKLYGMIMNEKLCRKLFP